ncbi:OmpA family protein [Tenacibaculum sp. 190524A02b]|uniref:OmpA family protein n=1 Tax=Tenacibaculum vairaonense TaxID=3137860 RepID=UPI0031FAF39F
MKKAILFILLVATVSSFGQRKYAANRYFQEYSYKKAAELYEYIVKDDKSYDVVSKLADSYYYNAEFEKSEKWYSILANKYAKQMEPKHIFRYAQSLKSNGKVGESDDWLLKLRDKSSDSRAEALENNRDYFAEFSNKEKIYINVHNLSSNTKYSDFGGFVQDEKFYFASTKPDKKVSSKLYRWNNQPYLNIYTSNQKLLDKNGIMDVDKPEKVQSLSTKYHESNAVITNDGYIMYFTRDNYDGKKLRGDKKRTTHLKIYKATKNGEGWGNIKELPFNSNEYSIGHPALSKDEKTLYFVSDMPAGFGATDIYKVAILGGDKYGDVINLGKEINTEGREMFPYVGTNNTLYFASDGHLGLGALDVFESKIIEGKLTEPVNLGAPINSPLDDFAFTLNRERTGGYFSSNRGGGKGDDDIYSFLIYSCKEDINGVITDSRTGAPIDNVKVRLINEKGEPVSEQITKEDGAYSFKKIDCEKNFVVTASKQDYKATQKKTGTEDIDDKIVTANLQLESLIVGDQIVIAPIYFDYDKYFIREDAKYELENVVTVMQNNPGMVIKIESHTDSRGGKVYNRTLSDNRAKSTRDYIISRGIGSERIQSAIGYGEDYLLNKCDDANQSNCSEAEHQRNRRSYFYIVKNPGNIKVVNQFK